MDIKHLLCGHVKEQFNEALLYQAERSLRVHLSNRSSGSYVLVNIPPQKEPHKTYKKNRALVSSGDQAGDF